MCTVGLLQHVTQVCRFHQQLSSSVGLELSAGQLHSIRQDAVVMRLKPTGAGMVGEAFQTRMHLHVLQTNVLLKTEDAVGKQRVAKCPEFWSTV